MRIRHFWAALAAIVTVGAGLPLVVAAPASATTVTIGPTTCVDVGGTWGPDPGTCEVIGRSITNDAGNTWVVPDGVSLVGTQTFTNYGTIEVQAGGNIGVNILDNYGTITIAGQLEVGIAVEGPAASGTNHGSAVIRLASGSTFTLSPGLSGAGGIFTNSGMIEYCDATLNIGYIFGIRYGNLDGTQPIKDCDFDGVADTVDPCPLQAGSGCQVSAGPPPVIQAFGKPATGTCDEAVPEGLNWAGVPSGGWTESWERWMNDGRGGVVCTRTLSFSSGSGGWRVS
ncbi:MAG: hypothetical protein GC156_01325 [Actinomycetales bacterium]|nr:hypothetical protein [Actinomycetales bacterium]